MKVIKTNGDIIECTVEEYKAINRPSTIVVKEHTIDLTKPKHAGGRPKKVTGKTHTIALIRKSNPNDGRVKMWKFIHKAAKKYTQKGFHRDEAYKKGMAEYKKSKHI